MNYATELKAQLDAATLENIRLRQLVISLGQEATCPFCVPLYADPIPPAWSFQTRVQPWLMECFGPIIAGDKEERNHRFIEEALELVQACGCSQSEAHQLVDYVYGRPVGDPVQEAGGVMVTLAALCLAHGMDMHDAGETELARIWTKVEQIRAKQAAKPKHSALPQQSTPAETPIENNAAVASIMYVLANPCESPIEFLSCWVHGDFDILRKEWENVPEEVFIGADSQYRPKGGE